MGVVTVKSAGCNSFVFTAIRTGRRPTRCTARTIDDRKIVQWRDYMDSLTAIHSDTERLFHLPSRFKISLPIRVSFTEAMDLLTISQHRAMGSSISGSSYQIRKVSFAND